jgi:mono/diheme cytochrome c family protein
MEGVMSASRIAAAALAIGASAFVSLGAQTKSLPYSGEGDYQVFCSSCHGTTGKGDGILANSLKKHPPDLTRLAGRNGGVFPQEKVFKAVDGRHSGHGDSDMPAWAEVLAKATESIGEQNAAARINLLVEYLQTLQVK